MKGLRSGRDWMVHRAAVPPLLCGEVRQLLWLEVRRAGLSVPVMGEWSTGTWWPHLRDHPLLHEVSEYVELLADTSGDWRWCETQIQLRLPDAFSTQIGGPHLDEVPPWADPDQHYRAVFGVELSPMQMAGGSTVLHLPGGERRPIPLGVGDVLAMGPALPHSGSPNHAHDPRMALFYRQLERVPA